MEHCAEPLLSLFVCGQTKGDSGRLDALFGPANSLCHGCLRHQESVGNLHRRQAAHGAQGERNGRRQAQGGMTAHEEQNQRVILLCIIFYFGYRRQIIKFSRHGSFPAAAGQFASEMIGHAPACHLAKPAARIVRDAFFGPLHCCCNQRFLYSVFGVGEVMEAADDHPEHLRREFAQQVLGTVIQEPCGHGISSETRLMICRTSMGMLNRIPPGPGPPEMRAAIS